MKVHWLNVLGTIFLLSSLLFGLFDLLWWHYLFLSFTAICLIMGMTSDDKEETSEEKKDG